MKKLTRTFSLFTLFLTLFLLSCNSWFGGQPYDQHSDENPPGLRAAAHQKVNNAGSVSVEVIGLDSLGWSAERIYTGPIETHRINITAEQGYNVGYQDMYEFTGKIDCEGGCKLMKVRLTFEDTTLAKVVMASLTNSSANSNSGILFVVDWSITNGTVAVGDIIVCKVKPVSVARKNGKIEYMLVSESKGTFVPATPKQNLHHEGKKFSPIETKQQP